jgi:tetratricopeptide (TPR) repeat protein
VPRDPVLENERGGLLALRGDFDGAARVWLAVLDRAMNPAAFANAAAVAMRRRDAVLAQSLVDRALAAPGAPVDVARRAIQLALSSEPDGIARATRVATLARAIGQVAPDDAWASLVLARASTQLGQKTEARELLARVETQAPGTPMAAEAQRARFAIEEPEAAIALEATLRAAGNAPAKDLEEIAVRARRLAMSHGGWLGWLAASVAERRAGRLLSAREAANTALEVAPGCSPAHAELASVAIGLGDGARAVLHAEKTLALEGEQPRLVGLLARALAAAGRRDEAMAVAGRATRLDPSDETLKLVAEEIAKPPVRDVSWPAAIGATAKRWLGRKGRE